jgi:hypothetical protein
MKLEIFEPALCCASGVCGPNPDKALIELQNLLQIAAKAGIKVSRYAINQAAVAFVSNATVKQFIRTEGPGKLPLTLLDGIIIKQEEYPTLEELAVKIPALQDLIKDGKINKVFN